VKGKFLLTFVVAVEIYNLERGGEAIPNPLFKKKGERESRLGARRA